MPIKRATPWPGPHPAPVFSMAPTNDRITMPLVEPWIQAQIIDAGFHAPHIPMEGELPTPATVRLIERANELGGWPHLWFLGNVQWGTHPKEFDAARDRCVETAAAIAHLDWTAGISYDTREDRTREEVAAIIQAVDAAAPGHMLGARAQPQHAPYAGGLYLIEQHLAEYPDPSAPDGISRKDDAWLRRLQLEAINQADGRPVGSTDRFRVREWLAKDLASVEQAIGVADSFMRRRIAVIIGYNPGASVSDWGSAPWPNAAAWREMLRGADPVPPPVVEPPPEPEPEPEPGPAPPPPIAPPPEPPRPKITWEDIMGILDAPIIDEALKLVREFLDERQSQREFTLKLIERTSDDALVDRLIEQYIDENAIRLENLQWWQARFRALGDVFDGDAWKRLADLFGQIGLDLPDDPPVPLESGD